MNGRFDMIMAKLSEGNSAHVNQSNGTNADVVSHGTQQGYNP